MVYNTVYGWKPTVYALVRFFFFLRVEVVLCTVSARFFVLVKCDQSMVI